MNRVMRFAGRLSVGARVAVVSFFLIAIVFGGFVWAFGQASADLLAARAAEAVMAQGRQALDTTANPALVRDRLLALKVGRTGGYYVLDAEPGKDYGKLVIAARGEGRNLLGETSSDGRAYIKEILDRKEGVLHYRPAAAASGGERVAAFVPYQHWVVVGDTQASEFTHDATTLRNRFAGAALIALLVLAGVLYAVIRGIVSRPLSEATGVARRLAAGDLTTRIETRRADEIGQLLKAINSIGQGLANVVWNIRNGTETLAHATTEIAAGNQDLSARTEQQASSLEQTAAAMEQMTATVKQNAANAMQATRLAATASQTAVKGGSAVADIVGTMASINQSSGKIVNIIGVIDDIAFQTNILALNAAVEAARAGEQGRGFAVVAAEVRNLAQRSAAAAKEIKALIEDSVDKVRQGSQRVAAAGATMDEVVTSIQRVDSIMTDISTASGEQSIGIEQVNKAIAQMDQVTQQNAALVEEAAAAAESLQSQTTELNRVVKVFTIKTGRHGSMEEATAMVGKAIESLHAHGKDKTFAEINNKLGAFCDRDLYVVVYDKEGRNLAHGANAALVGKSLIDAKDGAGKLYVRERLALIKQKGKGWQEYLFLNPISKQMEAKSMWLDQFQDLIVGCGVYRH